MPQLYSVQTMNDIVCLCLIHLRMHTMCYSSAIILCVGSLSVMHTNTIFTCSITLCVIMYDCCGMGYEWQLWLLRKGCASKFKHCVSVSCYGQDSDIKNFIIIIYKLQAGKWKRCWVGELDMDIRGFILTLGTFCIDCTWSRVCGRSCCQPPVSPGRTRSSGRSRTSRF